MGPIPGLGRSLEEGMATHSQYSCLKNPMDREDYQAIVPGVAKSWTPLKRLRVHIEKGAELRELFQCTLSKEVTLELRKGGHEAIWRRLS